MLSVNYGTLYPSLLKLEQEGYVSFGMGHIGQQPESQVLQTYACRTGSLAAKRVEWEQATATLALPFSQLGLNRCPALRGLLLRCGGLFHKEGRDRELADEIESHLEMHIEDNLRAGMAPQEARRQALLKLGGIEQDQGKLSRPAPAFPGSEETLLQDLRFGLRRRLWKNPGFAAAALLSVQATHLLLSPW